MNAWLLVLIAGLLLVPIGLILLLILPERQGGTLRAFTIEVSAPGAGLVLIFGGLGVAVVAAPHVPELFPPPIATAPTATVLGPEVKATATAFPTATPIQVPTAGALATATAPVVVSCGFKLGFAQVHDLAPDIVGDCRENEEDVFGGTQQRTTKGILVYRYFVDREEWVGFNNDADTWILKRCNDRYYLAKRPNSWRFPDEPNPDHLPRIDYPPCPYGGAPGG